MRPDAGRGRRGPPTQETLERALERRTERLARTLASFPGADPAPDVQAVHVRRASDSELRERLRSAQSVARDIKAVLEARRDLSRAGADRSPRGRASGG